MGGRRVPTDRSMTNITAENILLSNHTYQVVTEEQRNDMGCHRYTVLWRFFTKTTGLSDGIRYTVLRRYLAGSYGHVRNFLLLSVGNLDSIKYDYKESEASITGGTTIATASTATTTTNQGTPPPRQTHKGETETGPARHDEDFLLPDACRT